MDFQELLDKHLSKIKWLAYKISKGKRGQSVLDDLISVGMVALWQSSKRWDPLVSFDLWNYAQSRVRGAMLDELRQLDQLPRTAREKIKRDEVDGLQWALLKPCGMDKVVNIPSRSNPESECQEGIQKDAIRKQIEKLPPRLQKVVLLYFLEDEFLADIGKQMGITPSRVCQLKTEALCLMRDQMSDDKHFEGSRIGDPPSRSRKPKKDRLKLTYAGKTMSMLEWSREIGLPVATLYSRLNHGWPVKKMLTTPIKNIKRDGEPVRATPEPEQRSPGPSPLLLEAIQSMKADSVSTDEPSEILEMRRRCCRLDEIDAQIRDLLTERRGIMDCLQPLVSKQPREG